jgi:hypothetical protein
MPVQDLRGASLARLIEMLADRFGAFEAIAYSTIKLARFAPADELSMDPIVAEAILEFGEDLRAACSIVSDTGTITIPASTN